MCVNKQIGWDQLLTLKQEDWLGSVDQVFETRRLAGISWSSVCKQEDHSHIHCG